MTTYLSYELSLHAPLILAALGGDPNSAQTRDFIPGSVLRGALAARLLARGVDAESEEFQRFILSDEVRFLNAYPKLVGGRSLPVPASWKGEKDDTHKVYALDAFDEQEWPDASLAGVAGSFIDPRADKIASVDIGAHLHTQRDRQRGRAWTDEQQGERRGNLFTYEYIEKNQTFVGIVALEKEQDATLLKELLSSEAKLALGRSRNVSYGGDAVLQWSKSSSEVEYNTLFDSVGGDQETGSMIRMLLTSSYIGRHPLTGQIDPCAIDAELARVSQGRLEIARRFWSFETWGGFNRKWRLDLPQMLAARGGALFCVKVTAPITGEELRRIEDAGLGERRNEGFGRLAFLAAPSTIRRTMKTSDAPPRPRRDPVALAKGADQELLDFLQRRLLRDAAHRELTLAAASLVKESTRAPSSALLGRLRGPLRQGTSGAREVAEAHRVLRTWLDQDNDNTERLKRKAMEQIERCNIDKNRHLNQWLSALVSEQGDAWKRLIAALPRRHEMSALAQNNYLVSEEHADALLRAEAPALIVELIDATLAALARKNRKERSS